MEKKFNLFKQINKEQLCNEVENIYYWLLLIFKK